MRKSYRGTNKGKSLGVHGQIITAGEEAVDWTALEEEEGRMNVVLEDDSLAQLKLMVAGNAGRGNCLSKWKMCCVLHVKKSALHIIIS